MEGKVPKKKVEIGRWRARYLRRSGDGEVEGKAPKKKVEIGRWRARYLRRRWRLGRWRASGT